MPQYTTYSGRFENIDTKQKNKKQNKTLPRPWFFVVMEFYSSNFSCIEGVQDQAGTLKTLTSLLRNIGQEIWKTWINIRAKDPKPIF